MSVVVNHGAVGRIATAKDPKQAILDTVGDLAGIHLMGDTVLIGTYIRPEKTSGGIYRPANNVQEDVFQGKVGLLVRLGPDAFEDTEDYTFNFGDAGKPKVGDWVVYKVGDAWPLSVRGLPCRYIRDIGIRMKIDDPSLIF